MREALKPNLLQTLEHTPVHRARRSVRQHRPRQLVDHRRPDRHPQRRLPHHRGGFGADMGAERFFNIKCRDSGPGARRGGAGRHGACAEGPPRQVQDRRRQAAARPSSWPRTPTTSTPVAPTCVKQIENVKVHGVSPVVAINAFPTDFDTEHRPSARSPSRSVPASRCAPTSPTAARAPSIWPKPWSRRATSQARSRSAYPRRGQPQGEDRNGRHKIYGAGNVDVHRRPPTRSWRATRRTGSAACRYASPRHTCRSVAIPR